MASSRISDLTTITAASTANDDYFVIFDSSTGLTKKIAKSEVSSFVATDLPAATILSKLLTVDGTSSGLDADLIRGENPNVYAKLAAAAFTGNVSVGGTFSASGTTTLGKVISTQLQTRVTSLVISSSTTLNAEDHANVQIFTGNYLTLNTGVFTQGDWVVLNATADARFTRGSGLTMYSDGTNTAQVWVRPYRTAVAIFDSATVCRIIGGTTAAPP